MGPFQPPAPITISNIKLTAPTVTWCKHCAYPNTKLTFTLSANADVRLKLLAKLAGRFKQVAVTTLHTRKGANSFRLAGRWHGQLVLHRRVQLLVQLKTGASWTTHKTLKLTVRSPVHHQSNPPLTPGVLPAALRQDAPPSPRHSGRPISDSRFRKHERQAPSGVPAPSGQTAAPARP